MRSSTASFAMTIIRDTADSNGILFEIGGGPRGTAAWIDTDGIVSFAAGQNGDNGVTVSSPIALSVGQRASFVFGVSAKDGRVWLFQNGTLRAFGRSVNGNLNGEWAAANDGAIGDASGVASIRIPVDQKVPLEDVTIIGGALDFYLYQLPMGARRG